MTIFPCLLAALVASLLVQAGLIERQDTVGNDDIVGLAAAIPSGAAGAVYKAYQPYLYVYNGCVPFPAVDASGNTNEGLSPSGASNGDCSISTGQVYVRAAQSGSYYGVMYAWYMPKDEPSDGLGHRHEWEGVIPFVPLLMAWIGGWDCSTTEFTLSGTSPLIKYESVWPINHQMWQTTTVGGMQPMVAWESLTAVVQNALETTDFGDATVPFKDSTFATNLAAASF
ncbi:hypothetical protein FKW77_000112 [Venturia effusa]|uniref:Uncharacterized protein n=1 Tax=Venturia effusa TaxID=50376 RepID=A0A517LJH7_9PEZI|nr:hypothetical protein FKW77_000112 [Venturia effusa]